MNEAIRQRARDLGFDLCGFATAAPPSSASHFQQWLAQGRHGTMAYLERNAAKRIDPRLVLGHVRSVVCLGVRYSGDKPRGPSIPPVPQGRGVVARYAAYHDYHDVLAGPLKALAEFITTLGGPGSRALYYVDTGPVLERDFALRAGLGFIGKHTNLISRRFGNWILLAEILTTLELEPDPPETNRCGACARCLAACPTGAIVAPFQLDARRCISYLTIELKGPIPLEFRPAIGNRIFGCDDCLAVCPWNRFAVEGGLMRERSRADLSSPELCELLALDEQGFTRRFTGTPMWRARRKGLLRNVCVALGNTGGMEALPALEKAAQDPEPLIAEHARWAIQVIRARKTAGN